MPKNEKYHHENLKKELIEEGIKLINEVGENGLSLRQIAIRCGVSNAAPYAHFASKEELLCGMQQHVTEEFTERLQKAVVDCPNPDTEEAIICMGREYVRFFMENPHYFKFLYFNDFMKIDVSLHSKDNYQPFECLRDNILRINQKLGRKLSDKEQEVEILKLWITVQGYTSIVVLSNVKWSRSWEDAMDELLF